MFQNVVAERLCHVSGGAADSGQHGRRVLKICSKGGSLRVVIGEGCVATRTPRAAGGTVGYCNNFRDIWPFPLNATVHLGGL